MCACARVRVHCGEKRARVRDVFPLRGEQVQHPREESGQNAKNLKTSAAAVVVVVVAVAIAMQTRKVAAAAAAVARSTSTGPCSLWCSAQIQ